jgi:Holliday junction resolvase
VALTWRRNGWKDVAFLPENAQGKQPDIRAARGEETWLIEAKRLDKTSQYSELERQKWLMMWARFSDALGHSRLSLLFDIVFHVELADLPANFLQEHLTRHIRAVDAQAVLVSDTVWTVSVRPVDINAARAHLEKFYVKYPSEQLNMLITGPRNLSRGFTYVISPKLVYAGERALTNVFVDEIDFASGALWSCDAARAIEKKARDVRGHIARAVEQIPLGQRAAIHIGLETLDGAEVERERLSRIINTVRQFDLMGRNVRWIYCHLFQSYAPPQGAWTIDETTFFFTHNRFEKPPLQSMTLIVPEAEMLNSGVHWERPPPY